MPTTLTTPPSRQSRAVTWFLLAATFLFLTPVGILLIWFGVAEPADHWDDAARLLVVGLGLVATFMFLGLGMGLIRYNILGRPRVRIEPSGLTIGAHTFVWTEIEVVGTASPYGVPYLLASIRTDAIGRLPLVERTMMMTLWPKAPDGRRMAWISEQQLGESAEAASQRAASMIAIQ
jgi:hypothetical protein